MQATHRYNTRANKKRMQQNMDSKSYTSQYNYDDKPYSCWNWTECNTKVEKTEIENTKPQIPDIFGRDVWTEITKTIEERKRNNSIDKNEIPIQKNQEVSIEEKYLDKLDLVSNNDKMTHDELNRTIINHTSFDDVSSDLSSIDSKSETDLFDTDFSDLEEDLKEFDNIKKEVPKIEQSQIIEVPKEIKFTDNINVSDVVINKNTPEKTCDVTKEVYLLRIFIKHTFLQNTNNIYILSIKDMALNFEKLICYAREKQVLNNKELLDELFIKIINLKMTRTNEEYLDEMFKLIQNYFNAPKYRPLTLEIESVDLE